MGLENPLLFLPKMTNISRPCLPNRNTFLPSPIISTYFRVFSGNDEHILNKIIKARETYEYLEHICMKFLRQNVLQDKRHSLNICEVHTFGFHFYPKFLEKRVNFLWYLIFFTVTTLHILLLRTSIFCEHPKKIAKLLQKIFSID